MAGQYRNNTQHSIGALTLNVSLKTDSNINVFFIQHADLKAISFLMAVKVLISNM